jgi:hypothetical protein
MMPSGLTSMSSGSSACISCAAVSGLKGVVERPWNDDDQSIAGLAWLPLPLPFWWPPLSAVANAGEGADVVVSVVGIWAAKAGSTSATVAAWRMAACGSMTPLTPAGGPGAGAGADAGVGVALLVAGAARARDTGTEEDAVRGRGV